MRFSRESGAATPRARATHNNSEESHEPIFQPEPDGPPRGGMDGYSSFLNVASPLFVYGGKRLPMNKSKLFVSEGMYVSKSNMACREEGENDVHFG